MKKLYFWFIIVNFLTPEFAFGFEQDKLQHFGISAAISGTSAYAMKEAGFNSKQQFLTGLAIATAIGYAKEQTDHKFDNGDMIANILGAFTGAMFVVEFD